MFPIRNGQNEVGMLSEIKKTQRPLLGIWCTALQLINKHQPQEMSMYSEFINFRI